MSAIAIDRRELLVARRYSQLERRYNGLTFIDVFCGAGGSSIGLTEAGFELKLAANHAKICIDTHSANHPWAEHIQADVSNYDMRRLPTTDIAWFSPICTEMSPAGGRKRKRKQVTGQSELELYGPIKKEEYERTRATFHDVIRATEVHRYKVVIVENVVDVAHDWELFDWWVEGMKRLRPGYNVQFVSVSSAHVGGDEDGNDRAPQWRDRLYLVFTRVGIPLPDVDPQPIAWCPVCARDVHSMQSWKKPGRRIGKYRQQYTYVCERSECRHATVEPYVLPASAAIDWSDLGQRIGDRKRPLAAKTVARIEAGLAEFARPIVAAAAGNTFERYPGMRTVPADGAPVGALTTTAERALASPPVMLSTNHDGDGRAYPAHEGALPSRTVRIGDGLAVDPLMVPCGGTWRDGAAPVADPMGARTTRETDGLLCPPFIAELRGGGSVARGVDDALATVTAGGNHHGLTVPPGAFYVKNYGGNADPGDMVKAVESNPLGSVTTKDHHSLVIPFRRGARPYPAIGGPLSTVATREQHGFARLGVDIDDCLFRMLKPREHLRAQRFPDSYEVLGNVGQQTLQAGNAVSANVARWLGSRVAAVLCGEAAA